MYIVYRIGGIMATTTATELRNNLHDYIGAVEYRHERIIVTRNGKPTAALVSLADLELLRALEDRLDLIEAEAAKQEAQEDGFVSWDDVKAELGR